MGLRSVKWVLWLLVVLMPLSSAAQDRVGELEEKIKSLESQLNELKQMLIEQRDAQQQAEQAKAEEAKEAAAPAPALPVTTLLGTGGTLKIGGDIRFRGLYFDNLWDFDDRRDTDQREVFRFRPRVFFDWAPDADYGAYVRLTKEWFYGQDEEAPGYDVEAKDLLLDNAYADWRHIFGSDVDLRVGRQDMIYGEGMVLLDGTPFDGSQTISFDAVKMTWNHGLGSTDFIYSKLHENDFNAADDEDLYGIYNKFNTDWAVFEPYFLVRNKNQTANEGIQVMKGNNPDDNLIPGSVGIGSIVQSFDPSPAEETYLIGMRVTKSLDVSDGVKLDLAAEGGKEFGKVDFTGMDGLPDSLEFSRDAGSTNEDRDAWGMLANGTLTFNNVAWKPSVKMAFSYFSGDDPDTQDYEGWDDFYGQWPKYSELYIYSIYDGFKSRTGKNDPDIGAWANMMIPEVQLSVQPTDKLTQSIRYLYFLADEDTGPGDGDERGHNVQLLTHYVFNQYLSGHILFEWFDPGDFYASGADDALFARFQLLYRF